MMDYLPQPMWGQLPEPALSGAEGAVHSGEARRVSPQQADTSPDKPAHPPPHSEPKPPAPHPSANTYTDKSSHHPATSSRPPNKTPAAHSANKDQTPRRNPAPHPMKSPTTANPQSWPRQTPPGTAADQDPHSAKQAP